MRVYINNIVVFSKTLKEYLEYLIKVFRLFKRINILIKLSKIYLDYSLVVLLEQKIDSLELIITKEKLEAIFKLCFSTILKVLKLYLELTR